MSNPLDLFSLQGRMAVLTGATGHLGRAFAHALCEAGAQVVLVARGAEKLEGLRLDLEARGNRVAAYAVDLCRDDEVQTFASEVLRAHPKVDILVNNAYSGPTGTLAEVTQDAFASSYSLTVTAACRLVQLLHPSLRAAAAENAGGGAIVNVASMYGVVSPDPRIYADSGFNNPPWYGPAKAGLVQLTRYLACHLAPERIRVNAISPGPFPPASLEGMAPSFHADLCRKVPMGRTGRPDELRGALLFLASDASSYVTGINLPVDGGWTAW